MLSAQETCREAAQLGTAEALMITIIAVAVYVFLAFVVWLVIR